MNEISEGGPESAAAEPDSRLSLGEMLDLLRAHLKLLTIGPLAAGLLALGIAFLIPPRFTARTTFIPPQQAQSGAALALASLGPLAGLAGGAGGLRTPGEQYVTLMQSVTVADRIVDQFKLMDVYDAKFRVEARKRLAAAVIIAFGKKDGLITVEVNDRSPQRAAEMANRYVDELRRLLGTLALTEAQQRRAFFDRQLAQSRDRLVQAQQELQASGFNAEALKAEPKAAADAYAKLKAEATAAEVRLQILRGSLADGTSEVRQQQAALSALREQLARAERASEPSGGADYVGKYREFKYQEVLFELYARQLEVARMDESREGALIQVVDPATPPETRSWPRRSLIAIAATIGVAVALLAWLLLRRSLHRSPLRHRPST